MPRYAFHANSEGRRLGIGQLYRYDATAQTAATQALTGEELYILYAAGDIYAFEDIVALYKDDLSRYIFALVRDVYEAEDIVIETFAQLALSKSKFAGRSSLKTYLYAIGMNLTRRKIRKNKHRYVASLDDVLDVISCPGKTPEAVAVQNELHGRLHEAIAKLKKEHRDVLTLLYFENMNYQQAAGVMNKRETQIKDLAYRAKAALRKQLEKP